MMRAFIRPRRRFPKPGMRQGCVGLGREAGGILHGNTQGSLWVLCDKSKFQEAKRMRRRIP